jgi:hypothetical protein
MKSLTQHINEKLVLKSNSKIRKQEYNYHPKTRDELMELVEQLIKERGDDADLNDINTSDITDMSKLFFKSEFNGDISGWDVSNVEEMRAMFKKSKFTGENGDISNWDVSNVKDMESMFEDSKFNTDISKWNISNVPWMYQIFANCPIKAEYKPTKV